MAAVTILSSGANTRRSRLMWPPKPRAPLPAFPETPEPYAKVLPFVPPSTPQRDFVRANFQPFVPGFTNGFNDKDRSILMTWELPAISSADQDHCLDWYATRFTHLLTSFAQALNLGASPEALERVLVKAKSRGLFNALVVMGAPEDYPRAIVQPWIDKWAAMGLLDILIVAWQADKWWSPVGLAEQTFYWGDYAVAKGLLVGMHWLNDACAWWAPPDGDDGACSQYGFCDRFSYQQVIAARYGRRFLHFWQIDPWASVDATQWQAAKVLQACTDNGPLFVVAEYDAQRQYNDPTVGEAMGALKGYINLCASWNGRVASGYLEDACFPDGRAV